MPWEHMPPLGGQPLALHTDVTPARRTHIAPLSRVPGTLELFSITADGKVQVSFWHTGYAPQWKHAVISPCPNDVAVGGIAAVARDTTHMEVFCVSPAGAIVGYAFDNNNRRPPWSPQTYTNPGVAAPGSAVRAVSRHPQLIEVFFFGPGGSVEGIYRKMAKGEQWRRYPTLAPAGSADALTSGLAAVSRDQHNAEVWWTTADGRTHGAYASGDPSTTHWKTYAAQHLDVPGLVAGYNNAVLAAQARDRDHLGVFFLTPAGAVCRAEIALGPGQEWRRTQLAGPGAADAAAGIACCTPRPGAEQVFWRAPTGAVATAWWDAADQPPGWRGEDHLSGIEPVPGGALVPGSCLGAVSRWAENREVVFASAPLEGGLAGCSIGPRLPPPPPPEPRGKPRWHLWFWFYTA